MPSYPRLAALPAIRKLADTMADDFDALLPYEAHHGPTVYDLTIAFVAQLSDISRPASRDAVARLVAEAVGLTCGATAPELRRFRLGLPDGSDSWAWALLGAPGEQFFFTGGNVTGISTITDPAEALTLIALSVLS